MSADEPTLPDQLRKGDFEALADLRYQIRRYLRFSETVTQQHGITALQYLLLLQVKGYPGRDWATITELAERLQAHHHAVVTLVTRCEEAGLVERRKGEGDQRVVRVFLLPKGDDLVARLALMHREQLLAPGSGLAVPGASVFMESGPG